MLENRIRWQVDVGISSSLCVTNGIECCPGTGAEVKQGKSVF
jgi:hypothetical protein